MTPCILSACGELDLVQGWVRQVATACSVEVTPVRRSVDTFLRRTKVYTVRLFAFNLFSNVKTQC